jgi:hypothetical protein
MGLQEARPRLGLAGREDDGGQERIEEDRPPGHPQNVDPRAAYVVLLANDPFLLLSADP